MSDNKNWKFCWHIAVTLYFWPRHVTILCTSNTTHHIGRAPGHLTTSTATTRLVEIVQSDTVFSSIDSLSFVSTAALLLRVHGAPPSVVYSIGLKFGLTCHASSSSSWISSFTEVTAGEAHTSELPGCVRTTQASKQLLYYTLYLGVQNS